MFMRNYLILMMFFSFVGAASAATPSLSPDLLARKVTDEVLAALRGDSDIRAGDQKKARELIEGRIAPHFNFASMAKLALGRNWREASAEQRRALTAEFRALLVQTYTASLLLYKDQEIEYRPLKLAPEDTDVIVHSLVRRSGGGEPVQVDFGMEKTGEGWKVYNVMIARVSLVENYRSTFNSEIRKNGVDGLIKALRDKNSALLVQAK